MQKKFYVRVYGKRALFANPVVSQPRSYDIITPSAARGILESIFWKPQMKWVIDKIFVKNAPSFETEKVTEVTFETVEKNHGRTFTSRTFLTDVSYVIQCHIEIITEKLDDEHQKFSSAAIQKKYEEIATRRLTRHTPYKQPYMGVSDFRADFDLVSRLPKNTDPYWRGERDLGRMLLHINFVPDERGTVIDWNTNTRTCAKPVFFPAIVVDGVLDLSKVDV